METEKVKAAYEWLKGAGANYAILTKHGPDSSLTVKTSAEQKFLDDSGKEKGKVSGGVTYDQKHTETVDADGKTTEDTTKTGATASGSNNRGGLDLSVSKTGSVKLKEGKDSNGRTVLTVTIAATVEGSAGAKFSEGVASMGMKESGSKGKELSMTFVLDPNDPDYKKKYAAVKAANTPEKLQALKSIAGSTSTTTSVGKDTDITAGVGGVEFGVNQGGKVTKKVTQGPDGETTEIEGESHGGASLGAGPVKLKGGREDTVSGKVDATGKGTGESKHKDSATDLGKTVTSLEDSIKTKGVIATAKDIAKGKKPLLEDSGDTEGKSLDDDSYGRLAELAKNQSGWNKAWTGSVDNFLAWQALRPKVLAANGDRKQIQKLMAEFNSQDTGRSDIINRATGGTGVAFEWPDKLAGKKPIFDELVIGDPRKHARDLAAQGNAKGAIDELNAALGKLDKLQQDIQTYHDDFKNLDTMYQMMDQVTARRTGIRTELGKLIAAASAKPKPDASTGAKDTGSGAPPSADDEKAKALEEQKAKIAARNQIVEEYVPKCLTAQGNERRIFGEVEKELEKKNHWYSGNPDPVVLMEKLNSLRDSYSRWDDWVKKLRDVFVERGDSPDRVNQYAPNKAHYQDLYNQSFKS